MTPLLIIDGIGPFFRHLPQRRINWSKIPFCHLLRAGRVDHSLFPAIRDDFSRLCDTFAQMGFNAVTLDDVIHLADWPGYDPDTRDQIHAWREEFTRLFDIAGQRGLDLFLTADVLPSHPTIERAIGRRPGPMTAFLGDRIAELFAAFPRVRGVIFRIGESDAVDVADAFHSRLALRSPADVRRFLRALLPVFDRWGRDLILRTWTVGAYPVGDLMWNRHTFLRTFEGLDHPRLILSLKYGESDFFRYLPLSKQFHRTAHRKIIELQARREYEGFGEFPAFTGWEYESYLQSLAGRPDLVGLSVWCQTGGWTAFRRLTYLRDSSPWTELNVFCALRMFRDHASADQALEAFRAQRFPHTDPVAWRRFLRLSDEVIRELLYLNEFALRKLYFRRVRIPPQIVVYWDHIFINHYVRQFLRCFVLDGEARIREGRFALEKLDEMIDLAIREDLPVSDLRFQRDTFAILAAAREFFFRPRNRAADARLVAQVRRYRATYSPRFNIFLGLLPIRLGRRRLRWMLNLLFRPRRGYRVIDRLLVLRLLGAGFPFLLKSAPARLTEFAEGQGMGWRALFR